MSFVVFLVEKQFERQIWRLGLDKLVSREGHRSQAVRAIVCKPRGPSLASSLDPRFATAAALRLLGLYYRHDFRLSNFRLSDFRLDRLSTFRLSDLMTFFLYLCPNNSLWPSNKDNHVAQHLRLLAIPNRQRHVVQVVQNRVQRSLRYLVFGAITYYSKSVI
jgi:hypothetical protein